MEALTGSRSCNDNFSDATNDRYEARDGSDLSTWLHNCSGFWKYHDL